MYQERYFVYWEIYRVVQNEFLSFSKKDWTKARPFNWRMQRGLGEDPDTYWHWMPHLLTEAPWDEIQRLSQRTYKDYSLFFAWFLGRMPSKRGTGEEIGTHLIIITLKKSRKRLCFKSHLCACRALTDHKPRSAHLKQGPLLRFGRPVWQISYSRQRLKAVGYLLHLKIVSNTFVKSRSKGYLYTLKLSPGFVRTLLNPNKDHLTYLNHFQAWPPSFKNHIKATFCENKSTKATL
jgi:hypothetical protein